MKTKKNTDVYIFHCLIDLFNLLVVGCSHVTSCVFSELTLLILCEQCHPACKNAILQGAA